MADAAVMDLAAVRTGFAEAWGVRGAAHSGCLGGDQLRGHQNQNHTQRSNLSSWSLVRIVSMEGATDTALAAPELGHVAVFGEGHLVVLLAVRAAAPLLFERLPDVLDDDPRERADDDGCGWEPAAGVFHRCAPLVAKSSQASRSMFP